MQPVPATVASPINSANIVSLFRLVLAALLFVLIALEAWWSCLGVLALGAFSDWLDGHLARTRGLITPLGRVLDPLMDKVFLGGAFIFLLPLGAQRGWLLPWMVTVIVARELLVTGLRGYLESVGVPFGADWLGKLKTVLQFAALIAVFVSLTGLDGGSLDWARDGLLLAMLLATILSGLQYFWRGGAVLLRPPSP